MTGNEAIGRGALQAGCRHFFGYPITPQSDIPEFFARELPKVGGAFVQSESESASIAMVYGAAASGVRAMTSTSSPGWALMQELMSHAVNAEVPFVIVNVQRGGPGQGTTRHSQMDYLSVTRGGGQGGYKNIVLAPASVHECFDLMQLAFHLADKYRNPVVVLSDAIIGQMAETVELKALDLGATPQKDWATKGIASRGGERSFITSMQGLWGPPWYGGFLEHLDKKAQRMREEVRYELFNGGEASLLLVAFGSTARFCKEAIRMARREGSRVALLRPITLWPFPYEQVGREAGRTGKVLVVEDSLGQMIDDVKLGVEGRADVHLLGALARHLPTDGGMIWPDRVLEEIRELL